MWKNKKRKISGSGILSLNIIGIDDTVIEWLEADAFNLADLAKVIGIDRDHKAKAKVTIEIVDEPCELCGKLTTGDKLCDKCGKLVCDECVKTDAAGRYCPTCYDLKKQPIKL